LIEILIVNSKDSLLNIALRIEKRIRKVDICPTPSFTLFFSTQSGLLREVAINGGYVPEENIAPTSPQR
jgi:hypothetical protein